MDEQRHYCAYDYDGENHTCTAWDGTGVNTRHPDSYTVSPNHNLVESCPNDVRETEEVKKDHKAISKCEYRMPKIPSIPIHV
jgi:hypothetical protein